MPNIKTKLDLVIEKFRNKHNETDCEGDNYDELMDFIRASFLELLEGELNSIVGEEKEIGNRTHCKTCGGHIAAGECVCLGYNLCRSELLSRIKARLEH